MEVNVSDIREAFETTSTLSDAAIQSRITEAMAELRNQLGNLDRWANTPERVENLTIVIHRVVMRWMRNPEGLRSEQGNGYSYSRDPLVASGTIWITDRDWKLLGISKVKVPRTVRVNRGTL